MKGSIYKPVIKTRWFIFAVYKHNTHWGGKYVSIEFKFGDFRED